MSSCCAACPCHSNTFVISFLPVSRADNRVHSTTIDRSCSSPNSTPTEFNASVSPHRRKYQKYFSGKGSNETQRAFFAPLRGKLVKTNVCQLRIGNMAHRRCSRGGNLAASRTIFFANSIRHSRSSFNCGFRSIDLRRSVNPCDSFPSRISARPRFP